MYDSNLHVLLVLLVVCTGRRDTRHQAVTCTPVVTTLQLCNFAPLHLWAAHIIAGFAAPENAVVAAPLPPVYRPACAALGRGKRNEILSAKAGGGVLQRERVPSVRSGSLCAVPHKN